MPSTHPSIQPDLLYPFWLGLDSGTPDSVLHLSGKKSICKVFSDTAFYQLMAKSLKNTHNHVATTYRIEDPRDRAKAAGSAWFPKPVKDDGGITCGGKAAQQTPQNIANSLDV